MDPSHLVCQLIDPLENIETMAIGFFMFTERMPLSTGIDKKSGIANFGSTEHRFPGSGTIEWSSPIQALLETGSKADLNIEGWHNLFTDNPRPRRSGLISSGNAF